MMTKEKAQDSLDCLDGISRGGLPINSLPLIMAVAQRLQDHIGYLAEEEAKIAEEEAKKKRVRKKPAAKKPPET